MLAENQMTIDEVKKTLDNYAELEKRVRNALEVGGIHFSSVDSIELDGDYITIYYCDVCRGETYHYEERLPVKMLTNGVDVYAEWNKVREERKKNRKKAKAAAKRAAKRAEKAEAKKKVKACLAEMKRLKEQYPELFS